MDRIPWNNTFVTNRDLFDDEQKVIGIYDCCLQIHEHAHVQKIMDLHQKVVVKVMYYYTYSLGKNENCVDFNAHHQDEAIIKKNV